MKYPFYIVVLFILATGARAWAETSAFTDATGNHLWSDPENWSAGIPDAPVDERGEFAFLSDDYGTTGHYAAIDYVAPSFWAIRLGQEGPNARLVMAPGGDLTVSHMIIGSTEHAGAVFDMQGGRFRCELSFIVSHQGNPGGTTVLRGGVISTTRLTIGSRGVMDIRGGELHIDGDAREAVQTHLSARRIVAFGDAPGARIDVRYADDVTRVSARGGPAPSQGCVEGPGRPLTVALMGDPQLHMVEESADNIRSAMDDLDGIEHDLLVPLGDLIQNRAEYYPEYMDLIPHRANTPVYSIAGNADRNAGLDAYLEATGLPLTYGVRVRGIRLLFLSVVETSGGHNHICHMGQEQVDWLRAELEADTTSTTAVFFHAPLFETTFRSGDRSEEPPPMSLYLRESGELRAMFQQHPNVRFYASAHIHPFRYGREDDEGRGGYALEDNVLHAIVGATANNKGSRILYVEPGHLLVRVRDHENQRWLDEYEYVYPIDTTLQPELDRTCRGVPEQREACPDGCGERVRSCDVFTCAWSSWSDCEPCPPDAGVDPPVDQGVEPPVDQDVEPVDAVMDSTAPRDAESVSDRGPLATDQGLDSSADMGDIPDGDADGSTDASSGGGCGCTQGHDEQPGFVLWMLIGGLALRRRRSVG